MLVTVILIVVGVIGTIAKGYERKLKQFEIGGRIETI